MTWNTRFQSRFFLHVIFRKRADPTKSLRGTALAGAAVLFSLIATGASADFIPAGSQSPPGVVLTAPGFTFGDTNAGATLSDRWYFNFATPVFITTADATNSDGAYTGFQLSLFTQAGTPVAGGTGNIASGPKEDSGFGPINLAPGFYYLQLVGTGITTDGFQFPEVVSGNLNVQPSTVPLPGALPLFATGLAGLGLIGFGKKKAKRG